MTRVTVFNRSTYSHAAFKIKPKLHTIEDLVGSIARRQSWALINFELQLLFPTAVTITAFGQIKSLERK